MSKIKLLAVLAIAFGLLLAAVNYGSSVLQQTLIARLVVIPILYFLYTLFNFFQLDSGVNRKTIPELFPKGLAIVFLSKLVTASTLYAYYQWFDININASWGNLLTQSSAQLIGITAMALILYQIFNRRRNHHDEDIILDKPN